MDMGPSLLTFLPTYILFHCVQGAFYLYLHEDSSYDEGRELCATFGLDLAKVNSQQDIDDLHRIYQQVPGTDVAWLGIHYNESHFLWPDGTLAEHTRWNNVADDEPDYLETSKCAVVKQSLLLWHTRTCSDKYPVLCGPYPPTESEETAEVETFTFSEWKEDQKFLYQPTSTMNDISPISCAIDCIRLRNCMFISRDQNECRMYSDIGFVMTNVSTNSVIWKLK